MKTVTSTDNVATFTQRKFYGNDIVRVEGATLTDTFKFIYPKRY